ncbi:MAG: hypothetical protein HQ559_02545 [Lentisphaerae bacterium]|nr:hypothetical protein [Lentisphaerota bacterium]
MSGRVVSIFVAVSIMLKRLELRLQEDRKLRRLADRASRMLNVENTAEWH